MWLKQCSVCVCWKQEWRFEEQSVKIIGLKELLLLLNSFWSQVIRNEQCKLSLWLQQWVVTEMLCKCWVSGHKKIVCRRPLLKWGIEDELLVVLVHMFYSCIPTSYWRWDTHWWGSQVMLVIPGEVVALSQFVHLREALTPQTTSQSVVATLQREMFTLKEVIVKTKH